MVRISRILATIGAAALAVALVAGTADARIGGGSSFGSRGMRTYSTPAPTTTAPSISPMQRSVTQPGAPGYTRPGGGFFGGLGSFASILGLLIQVVLVVIVARLIWNWWQRRQQPAFSAPGYGRQPMLRDVTSNLGGGGAGAPRPSGPSDQIGVAPADYDAFEHLLSETQAAYSNEDINALRARVTPEMLSYFAEDLAQNASRGVVNRVSDVKLLQGDLAEAWREGNTDYATVAMKFSLIDKMVDRATGRVVEGDDHPQTATEVWTFRRERGGNWLLSAVQQA